MFKFYRKSNILTLKDNSPIYLIIRQFDRPLKNFARILLLIINFQNISDIFHILFRC